jgi:hypothetical protein
MLLGDIFISGIQALKYDSINLLSNELYWEIIGLSLDGSRMDGWMEEQCQNTTHVDTKDE